jgi:hypothetical protein
LLVTCLLAAALPLQGVAATTMPGCPPPEPHSAHHAHGIDADSHEVASTATASDTKCSACAACCVTAALPVRLQAFEPSPPSHAFAPLHTAPSPVFLTGGLERPPRLATNPHRPVR